MDNENFSGDDKIVKEQLARAELRERFLRLMSTLSGGKCSKIKLCDDYEYSCNVQAFDRNFENVIVENLVTRHPQPIDKAILRMSDVIFMNFSLEDFKFCNNK